MPIVGLLVSLGLIVFLMRRGWSLGSAMFLGAAVISVFSSISFESAGHIFLMALVDQTTINLLTIILLISILGELLYRTGGLERMVKSLSYIFRDPRLLVAVLPALIGALPIPGGAIFSAPMVGSAGKTLGMDRLRMAVANIFYRHLLFLLFPLYPGMILAVELSGHSFNFFARFNTGILIATFIFSFWYIFRGKGIKLEERSNKSFWNKLAAVLQSLAPLIIVLAAVIVFDFSLPFSLALGVMLAFFDRFPWRDEQRHDELLRRLKLIIPGIKWSMLFAIAGIMVFKNFILYSSAVDLLAEKFVVLGIPLVFFAAILPLLIGLAIGNQSASLGVSIPIILPMVPLGGLPEIYLGLIYVSSMIGYVISPVHLCLILTLEYFNVPFGLFFKNLIVIMLFMFGVTVLTSFIWQFL